MKKIWKSIKNTVSYIWQLPQNILGVILCYIYCSDGDIYDWNKDYYHFWTEKWANNLVDKHYKKLKGD